MRIRDVMTPDAIAAHPATTLRAAAEMMRLLNVDSLPVVDQGRVLGLITDRDIVVRGLALGLEPDGASVSEVMSRDVQTCSVDDDVEDVARLMRDLQVRRLLVVDARDRLVGLVTPGDLMGEQEEEARPLGGFAEPSWPSAH
jgi:CBS domain-containing protein